MHSYPDEDAGEIPMAYVVKQPKSNLSEKQVMEFVAKQVKRFNIFIRMLIRKEKKNE